MTDTRWVVEEMAALAKVAGQPDLFDQISDQESWNEGMASLHHAIERLRAGNAVFAKMFLDAAYGPDNPLPPVWAQILNVVGEAGEFAEAYRRYSGWARRPGSLDDTAAELADVVISAYVAAERLGVDLDDCIEAKRLVVMSRGFRDARPEAS